VTQAHAELTDVLRGKDMTGNGDRSGPQDKGKRWVESANGISPVSIGAEELRLRTQQLSLREHIERHHFLLERLTAASARLIQALELGDVFEALTEIIANLIGSEEVAIFHYSPSPIKFALELSCGVEADTLRHFTTGEGMIGRAVHRGVSQFRERQTDTPLLPFEEHLTACIVLKSSREVVGVITIFHLLSQKSELEWVDFELLKFLEVYGAVAIQFQKIQGKKVAP
jgi:hypothetical protein